MCDDTQDLNRNFFLIPNFDYTKSETFFNTKFFWYRIRYFFLYQFSSIPNPIPSIKWNSFETEKFWNRNLTQRTQNLSKNGNWNFLRYKILTIPNLILFSTIKFFWYRNHSKNGKVSKWKSFKTEKFRNRKSHSGDDALHCVAVYVMQRSDA